MPGGGEHGLDGISGMTSGACLVRQQLGRALGLVRRTMSALFGQRVIRVCGSEQQRFAARRGDPAMITAAIGALMVLPGERRVGGEERAL